MIMSRMTAFTVERETTAIPIRHVLAISRSVYGTGRALLAATTAFHQSESGVQSGRAVSPKMEVTSHRPKMTAPYMFETRQFNLMYASFDSFFLR